MRTLLTGGALALLMLGAPANAQDETEITVQSPLLHPAAGLMGEHMHDGGEVMVGLRFNRQRAQEDR